MPQSSYSNHWRWSENIMSVCFRHVSYPAVSVSPPSTGAKGKICSHQHEKPLCDFANLQQQKIDTKWLALQEKMIMAKIFTHVPLLAWVFSVALSQGGVGIWVETLVLYWLGNSSQITYLLLVLVYYKLNVSMKHCFKCYTFPTWLVTF